MKNFGKKRVWACWFLVLCCTIIFFGSQAPRVRAETSCSYDEVPSDNDVDGLDLFQFIHEHSPAELSAFASEFGSICLSDCRSYLPCQISEADQCFEDALASDPDPVLKAFRSVTRIFALVQDPFINNLLTDIGIAEDVRTLCAWTADWPRNEAGVSILPEVLPASEDALDVLINAILPEVEGAIEDLSEINNTIADPFITLCEELIGPLDTAACENIEVDYGDVALFRAILHGLKTFLLMMDAYNWNVETTATVIQKIKNDIFIINEYLCDGDLSTSSCLPDFLKLDTNGADQLTKARESLNTAINSYKEASIFIRTEIDTQDNDLLSFPDDPEGVQEEEEFRDLLSDIQCSLDGPCNIMTSSIDDPFDLNLQIFFNDPIHIRDYMPNFTDDNKITCGVVDPTFNMIFPGFNNDRWAGVLEIPVPVTGKISIPSGHTDGNIFIYAMMCDGEPANLDAYQWCPIEDSAVLPAPGDYEISLEAYLEGVWIFAFWDKDSDGIAGPGDLYGRYPVSPLTITAVNCIGPSGIDIILDQEITEIKRRITSSTAVKHLY